MHPIASATFRLPDVVVILIYLAGMAAMGLYFSRRNRNTEDYFLGARSFPGWAIGLSMLGTSISSVSFLAFPAAAFALDYRQLVPNLMLPIVAIFAIFVFIPFFRRGQLTSAFEYLEDRYGPIARLYGTVSFVILQLVRLATVLWLAALPIHTLTGFPMEWVIVLSGLFIALYTVAGGFEAVVWTDVIQSIVLVFGGLFCFATIVYYLPGGVGQVFEVGWERGKFGLGDFDWDLSRRTFFTMALIGLFNWTSEYSYNQNVIQRYVAASSTREARKATLLCGLMSMPMWAFFFFVGTCLYVLYQVVPDPAVVALAPGQVLEPLKEGALKMKVDAVFPHFILTKVPAGIAGAVIAAVLAAAMSSLDSSINAIATVTVVDIVKKYAAPNRNDTFYLRVAWIVSGIAAAFMIGGALFINYIMMRHGAENMVDLGFIIGAVLGGCLLGMYLLGFFTTRVDYRSLMIALVLAIVWNAYLVLGAYDLLPIVDQQTLFSTLGATIGQKVYDVLNSHSLVPFRLSLNVHQYWVNILVNAAFVVLAYGISILRQARGALRPDVRGLTIWTMNQKRYDL
jgi:SSS family solute:Na+ symporter